LIKVKVNTKSLDDKIKQINEFIKGSIGRSIITKLAQFSIDRIHKRVKSGYGVTSDTDPNPSKTRLKKLSKSYIDFRNGKVLFFRNKSTGGLFAIKPGKKQSFPKPQLGEFGSPAKSNLTLTGQLLNSIKYKLTQRGFKIFIDDNERASPVWAKGQKQLTNKQVAEYVSKDRPFLALTDDEQARLKLEFKKNTRMLASKLKSLLTRR